MVDGLTLPRSSLLNWQTRGRSPIPTIPKICLKFICQMLFWNAAAAADADKDAVDEAWLDVKGPLQGIIIVIVINSSGCMSRHIYGSARFIIDNSFGSPILDCLLLIAINRQDTRQREKLFNFQHSREKGRQTTAGHGQGKAKGWST